MTPASALLCHRKKCGFTLIELIVTSVIFLLLTGVVYQTTWQYFQSYMKTDEKLENLSEAWQALRIIKEDISFADFPTGEPSSWRDFVVPDNNSFTVNRRRDNAMKQVKFTYDLKKGILSRTEDGQKTQTFLRERLRNLIIQVKTRPDVNSLKAGALPDAIFIHIRLELSKNKKKDAKPLVLDTLVVPNFANLKLQKKFCSESLPEAIKGI